jgi:hypothetical protein
MFMNKILLALIATAAFALVGCGGDSSAKACQKVAYCYKTSDDPNHRKCDLDKAVAEEKAKKAEEAGNLHTPLYEDCWEM